VALSTALQGMGLVGHQKSDKALPWPMPRPYDDNLSRMTPCVRENTNNLSRTVVVTLDRAHLCRSLSKSRWIFLGLGLSPVCLECLVWMGLNLVVSRSWFSIFLGGNSPCRKMVSSLKRLIYKGLGKIFHINKE